MSRRGKETKPKLASVRSSAPQEASTSRRSSAPQETSTNRTGPQDSTSGHTGPQAVGGNSKDTGPQAGGSKHTSSVDRQHYHVEGLSEERIEEFKEAFYLFDRTGGGNIEPYDLGKVMRSLGYNPTETELIDMIKKIGVESGQIDFKQFLSLMAPKVHQDDTAKNIIETFKMIDSTGNGLISKQELKQVMGYLGENLTDEEISEMMAEADLDGDGMVNCEEFVKMMTAS